MHVTMKDVASMAGVSTSTVSRVINDDPRISTTTKTKVMACIHQLDYKAHPIARSLKTNRTCTIGLVLPELTNPFYMAVAQGAEEELRRNGYLLLIASSGGTVQGERERMRLLASQVDGLLWIPSDFESIRAAACWPDHLPVVLADRLLGEQKADAVLMDNINGTYAAVEHLISRGCRRIGFIGANDGMTPMRERLDGYLRAMKDYFVAEEEELIRLAPATADNGARLYHELAALPDPPAYVLVAHEAMMAGVLHEAAKRLQGPTDSTVSRSDSLGVERETNSAAGSCGMGAGRWPRLAGFGDLHLPAEMGLVEVAIELPAVEMGRRAVRLLQHRMQAGPDPRDWQVARLKTHLADRQ